MKTLIVDPEFRDLIQPLTDEERSGLESLLKRDGCIDPLSIWNNTILDGHNRYEICNKLGIKYDTKNINAESREEAKKWIIQKQLGRRNLQLYQRAKLVLLRDTLYKSQGKERQGERTDLTFSNQLENVGPDSWTDHILAKEAGTSHTTIHRVRVIENEAPQEIKNQLSRGETTVTAEYKKLRKPQRRPSLTRKERIGVIRELSSQGYRAGQIAEKVGVKEEHVRLLARESNIELPDVLLRKRAGIDVNRILSETAIQAQSLSAGLNLVDSRVGDLDLSQIDGWIATLSTTISALNRLVKKLKGVKNEQQNNREIQTAS